MVGRASNACRGHTAALISYACRRHYILLVYVPCCLYWRVKRRPVTALGGGYAVVRFAFGATSEIYPD